MSEPERPACAICHLGAHRYGTSDPHHEYDAMACVNALLAEVEDLRAQLAGAVEFVEKLRRWLGVLGEESGRAP